jgi:thioredoxin reductase/SAM-dependent methyltransferase
MPASGSHAVERRCDVCVVGGSVAGLSAALQLVRQRRSVIVVDAGEARNASSPHMHGHLAADGVSPAEFAVAGRAEVRGYGGEILAARADAVTRAADGGFRVALGGGHAVLARRVLAATGLVDDLPAIEGIAEHWGRDVIHCPFCHGYEVRDRRIVLIATHPTALHPAPLFRQLSDRLTIVVDDAVTTADPELDALRRNGAAVHRGRAVRILAGADGRLTAVELAGGEIVGADAVAVAPRFRARAKPFAPLGLLPAAHPSGLGDVLLTDGTGATAVAGVHAAGNVTDPAQQIAQAAADGGRAGAMIAFSLAEEDMRTGARAANGQLDWDERYARGQLWSGNPNGTLVNEVGGVEPGRVLDVGAGEGGDAIWLAERGWRVTANDISQLALDRIAAEADRRELRIELLHADANALQPFEPAAYDLVSAQYASIPRTPDDRGVRNLLDAVAPGGVLLVVSHDLEPVREPSGAEAHTRPFDPDAYVRVEDVAAALGGSAEWTIEVHETRPRPGGFAASSHHVDDVVLRARRAT